MNETHLPLAPLLAAMGSPNHCAAARRLPVSRRTICRWSRDGIPAPWADLLAVEVGMYPGEIWEDWRAVEEYYWAWRAEIFLIRNRKGAQTRVRARMGVLT